MAAAGRQQQAQAWLQDAFTPLLITLETEDVKNLCQANHLSFSEMLSCVVVSFAQLACLMYDSPMVVPCTSAAPSWTFVMSILLCVLPHEAWRCVT